MSPYDFGGPVDYLLDINFPKKNQIPSNIVAPWFWYLKFQGPVQFFSYLGGVWGPGWVRRPILPVIKILPIDTQPETPTGTVGFGSIEEAIDKTNAGLPISQDAWGRFYFGGPSKDKWWWKVTTGRSPEDRNLPEYTIAKGCPKQRTDAKGRPVGPDITLLFKNTVQHWRDCWNNGAALANAGFASINPGGTYTCILPNNGGFSVPGPNPNETIPELRLRLGVDQYFGAEPPLEIFSSGNAFLFKQAWAFEIEVAQLDPFEWDFTSFPPKRTSPSQFDGGSGRPPFAITLDASANNPSILSGQLPAFPQNSPILVS